jgi:hypothetical protein
MILVPEMKGASQLMAIPVEPALASAVFTGEATRSDPWRDYVLGWPSARSHWDKFLYAAPIAKANDDGTRAGGQRIKMAALLAALRPVAP